MDNRPIGIFDSGIGGMTVYRQLKKILPNENYIYLADTLNSPYGDKSTEELNKLVDSNINFLMDQDVKSIVVACNTASTLDLESKMREFNIPIFDVLQAGIESLEDENKVIVAATKATVESGKYEDGIRFNHHDTEVIQVACPKIAPSIEFEDLENEYIQNIVDGYFKGFEDQKIDSLIMACTHYPIWEEYFQKALPETKMIDPAKRMAEDVKESLKIKGLLRDEIINDKEMDIVYVSGDERIFEKKQKNIFGFNIKICKKV